MKETIRFDRWSNKYDNSILQDMVFNETHGNIYELIKPYLKRDIKILDVACGTGKFLLRLQSVTRYNAILYGIDSSEGMIKQGKKKSWSIDWRVGNARDLPYPENTFDAITCSHAFHHFGNQISSVDDMYRVLKPNGILVIADGNRDGFWGSIIFGMVKFYEGNVYHASGSEMREMYLKVGFKNITQTRHNLLIPTLITMGEK